MFNLIKVWLLAFLVLLLLPTLENASARGAPPPKTKSKINIYKTETPVSANHGQVFLVYSIQQSQHLNTIIDKAVVEITNTNDDNKAVNISSYNQTKTVRPVKVFIPALFALDKVGWQSSLS